MGIPDVGKTAAALLVERFSNLDALINADESDISSIDGIGPVIAKSVHEFLRNDENMKMINTFRDMGFSMGSENIADMNVKGKLDGKIFVFTGALSSMTRDEAGELVKSFGGKTGTSVSSKTDYVVSGENAGSKLTKAENLGIRILNEQEFLNMINS
jgi:DNA ligase (NAD+)